jgi:radical SAM protein with 4Fe4S-binding SPASM domain
MGILRSARLTFRYLFARLFSLPYLLMIEPTDLCNLRCTFCYNQMVTRKRENHFLALEDFKKIIDEIKGHCVYLHFWFAGEPLLNPQLEEMVEYANKHDILCCIATNATLLTEERIERFSRSGIVRWIISFDAATKESYEKIKVGADFDAVLNNIRSLVERKGNQFVSLQFIVTRMSEPEIPLFISLARRLGVDEAYLKSLNTVPFVPKKIVQTLAAQNPLEKSYGRKSRARKHECTAEDRSAILCDGTVIPCSQDAQCHYTFGNVLRDSFRNIWQDKRYSTFRKDTKRYSESPLCCSCRSLKNTRIRTVL